MIASFVNDNHLTWNQFPKAGRRITVNVDQVRIYHLKKSYEGLVGVVIVQLAEDRNISRIFRSGVDLGWIGRRALGVVSLVKTGRKAKKTSVGGNKSGRREQWVNKRKRTSGSKESSVGLRQQPNKKKRTQEVSRCKRGVPSLLEENKDMKRRPPNRNKHKRRLLSSISSNQQAKIRNRKMEENNGQVPARGSRPGERPLQSSRMQQGISSPYCLRSRGEMTRKAGSRSSRTVQAQEGQVRSRRDQFRRSLLQTSSTVQTRSPGA
ncbi:hypothetical protein TNCV_3387081 [Trichonephila clavipes]|nr:hypothetical protein TNCV_3387081 [Trichonephila clavipes]